VEFTHIPVLLNETVNLLNIKPNGIYVDGTAGGGGHSQEILKRLDNSGKLIMFDQDPDAIKNLKSKFFGKNIYIINSNFANIKEKLQEIEIFSVNGVLFDLGVSSYQLDTSIRGFSYKKEALLDMRMSKSGISAYDIINNYSEENLSKILKNYAEEKFHRKISKDILKSRKNKPIKTTLELAEIVKNSIPAAKRRTKHPAKKTFQAIRIEVNKELENLKKGLEEAFKLLKPDGRFAVITFHSLEDKIVKHEMHKWCTGCICPKDFPICICGKIPAAKFINKKAIKPEEKEILENSRSKSAKLRVIAKI